MSQDFKSFFYKLKCPPQSSRALGSFLKSKVTSKELLFFKQKGPVQRRFFETIRFLVSHVKGTDGLGYSLRTPFFLQARLKTKKNISSPEEPTKFLFSEKQ